MEIQFDIIDKRWLVDCCSFLKVFDGVHVIVILNNMKDRSGIADV